MSGGRVLVLATESTVNGGAYQRSLLSLRPDLEVYARPCPLLVALAEEGRHVGGLVSLALREYLQGFASLRVGDARISPSRPVDTLLLGCTHFPVFRVALAELLGEAPEVRVVDSAETTARALAEQLASGLLAAAPAGTAPALTLMATDGADRFRRVGGYFLGETLSSVALVDI